MITVVLCDKQELRRLGLVAALAASDVEVAAEAAEDEDGGRYVNGHKPDVFVVGDDNDLLALSERARAVSPRTKIVALERRDAGPAAWRDALLASDALVLDDEHYTRFVSAVQCVNNGDAYIDGAAVKALVELEDADDLTNRERDILTLIAQGFTNREIGDQLFLSVRTVESHRAHIMQKLNLETRQELVSHAVETGLFPVG